MFWFYFDIFFYLVAIGWSAYQAYVGYIYGVFIYDSAYKKFSYLPPKCVRTWTYGVHHGAIYFVCSLSGFAALYLAHWLSGKILWSEVSGGTGSILIALAVFSVTGISGALPRIFYLGQK